jgi:hypothetical protein
LVASCPTYGEVTSYEDHVMLIPPYRAECDYFEAEIDAASFRGKGGKVGGKW